MSRFDTGRVDVHAGFSINAGISIIDEQEDDPLSIARMDDGQKVGGHSRTRAVKVLKSRRRLEEKLEEMELRRQINDYSFQLH
jgi:hypothetical protein